jgi:lysozyme
MDLHHALSLAVPLVFDAEGCELTSYIDTLATVPVWTIGHGNTFVGGKPVVDGMTCTQAQADQWAMDALEADAIEVVRLVHVPLSDPQAAACISLAYNIGVGAFARSTVLYALNTRLYYKAADRFLSYDHTGGVEVRGLLARRARERAVFLSGTAPAPVIPQHPGPAQPGYPPRKPDPAPEVESEADKLNQAEMDRIAKETSGGG